MLLTPPPVILPVCPQCGGPHTLSQCPNWRGQRILANGRWDNDSLEAEFHKRISKLLTKREQGYVMGAFREVFSATATTEGGN